MSQKVIDVDKLCELFDNAPVVDPEVLERQPRLQKIFEFVLNNDYITPEQLDEFDYEDLEYAMDAFANAPTKGMEHARYQGAPLYEYLRCNELTKGLSALKPINKGMTFI